MYNFSKGWYYDTQTVENDKIKTTHNIANPTIASGEGFWYYTQSAVKLDWADEAETNASN